MDIDLPRGTIPCPPYWEKLLIVQHGDTSVDLMETPDHAIWKDTFGDGEIDWNQDWRRLWETAEMSLGTGSDYKPGRVAVELQAYFANDTLCSLGALLDCGMDDAAELDAEVREVLAQVCGGNEDQVVDGCIGLVMDPYDVRARPCLTLLVSGPGGGAEAAMVVGRSLAGYHVNAGVAVRAIRDGRVGVVKIPFLPETYLKIGHPSYGIHWNVWEILARHVPSYEWGRGCLLWCSTVIQAVLDLKNTADLMVDDVYFDYMRIIPLSAQQMRSRVFNTELSIGKALFYADPHDFMFADWGA